jgi:hypothetical protein
MANLSRVLEENARLVIHGRLDVDEAFTAPSIETFDALLCASDPRRGISTR